MLGLLWLFCIFYESLIYIYIYIFFFLYRLILRCPQIYIEFDNVYFLTVYVNEKLRWNKKLTFLLNHCSEVIKKFMLNSAELETFKCS